MRYIKNDNYKYTQRLAESVKDEYELFNPKFSSMEVYSIVLIYRNLKKLQVDKYQVDEFLGFRFIRSYVTHMFRTEHDNHISCKYVLRHKIRWAIKQGWYQEAYVAACVYKVISDLYD